jgi:hypothetical protein
MTPPMPKVGQILKFEAYYKIYKQAMYLDSMLV